MCRSRHVVGHASSPHRSIPTRRLTHPQSLTRNLTLIGYDAPVAFELSPSSAPTDGCLPGGWEDASAWSQRMSAKSCGTGCDPQHPGACRCLDTASIDNPENLYECTDPVVLRVKGRSFGRRNVAVRVEGVARPISPLDNGGEPLCSACRHDHEDVRVRAPQGYGSVRPVTVEVDGRSTNALNYHFDAPKVTSVLPGTVGFSEVQEWYVNNTHVGRPTNTVDEFQCRMLV